VVNAACRVVFRHRGRRAASKRFNAAAWSAPSATGVVTSAPSATASSNTVTAPWPVVGSAVCAATPTITARLNIIGA
jgi:hypothetical protein